MGEKRGGGMRDLIEKDGKNKGKDKSSDRTKMKRRKNPGGNDIIIT